MKTRKDVRRDEWDARTVPPKVRRRGEGRQQGIVLILLAIGIPLIAFFIQVDGADQEEGQAGAKDGASEADQNEFRLGTGNDIRGQEQNQQDNCHAGKDGDGFREGRTGLCIHFNLLIYWFGFAFRIAVNQEACHATKVVLKVYFFEFSPYLK